MPLLPRFNRGDRVIDGDGRRGVVTSLTRADGYWVDFADQGRGVYSGEWLRPEADGPDPRAAVIHAAITWGRADALAELLDRADVSASRPDPLELDSAQAALTRATRQLRDALNRLEDATRQEEPSA